MNRLMQSAAFAAFTVTAIFAEEPQETGGLIERREAVPSKQIAVVNAQKALAPDVVADTVRKSRFAADLPFLLDATNAPARIELVECDCKSALMLMPEDYVAKVNVRALAADGAASTAVVARVEKEIIRAGYYLLGSGYGPRGCLTATVRTLKELDALEISQVSAEAVTHLRGGQKNGIRLIRWITYRDACKKGWAPAPDTPERKAIWDEYHTAPTEPKKITFDPKKGE